MKKIYSSIVLSLATIAMIFTSCSSNEKNQTVTLKNIVFNLEGPLYSGSNPSQYTYQVDLKTLMGDQYKEGAKITAASLKSAQIYSNDSSTSLDAINSLVLSLASDNKDVKMQELALLNPVPPSSTKADLKPSAEAKADGFFSEKQFYIILDVDLKEDIEANMSFKADLVFDVNYK
jgi:hypothetical protein